MRLRPNALTGPAIKIDQYRCLGSEVKCRRDWHGIGSASPTFFCAALNVWGSKNLEVRLRQRRASNWLRAN